MHQNPAAWSEGVAVDAPAHQEVAVAVILEHVRSEAVGAVVYVGCSGVRLWTGDGCCGVNGAWWLTDVRVVVEKEKMGWTRRCLDGGE